jgi:hypothetical protein
LKTASAKELVLVPADLRRVPRFWKKGVRPEGQLGRTERSHWMSHRAPARLTIGPGDPLQLGRARSPLCQVTAPALVRLVCRVA